MGIYIHLNIMPYKINPFRWAEVYEETLGLLKAHPSELMGIRYKNFKCGRRTYYSRELEHNKDNLSERKWRVEGDMESKKSGETFQMYYDLNIYRKRAAKEKINSNEILYNIVKENRTYTSVFSDKTQGEPYHQPMLAVASLIESRFPSFACTEGNITLEQSEEAVSWANSILKDKIDLPVCVEPFRLLKRLKKYFKGKDILEKFNDFFRGSYSEIYRSFCRELDRDRLCEWFIEEIKNCSSPGEEKVKNMLISWVKEREDIEVLSEIVCFNPEGPGFAPLEVVSAISSGLTVRDDKLTRSFCRVFPELKKEIRLILNKDRTGDNAKRIKAECIMDLYYLYCKDRWRKFDLDEGNIFKDIDLFELLDDFHKEILLAFALQLKNVRNGAREMLLTNSSEFTAEQLWEKVVKYSEKRRIVVTEDAWKWIDNEKNIDMLWVLLSLAMIDDHEYILCGMRRSVFENRAMCGEIVRLMNDDNEMLRAEDMILNKRIEEWDCWDYLKKIFSRKYVPEK